MAGGKETPRQKMIGMMYLVLTALLALNVSKQVLRLLQLLKTIRKDQMRIYISKDKKVNRHLLKITKL